MPTARVVDQYVALTGVSLCRWPFEAPNVHLRLRLYAHVALRHLATGLFCGGDAHVRFVLDRTDQTGGGFNPDRSRRVHSCSEVLV